MPTRLPYLLLASLAIGCQPAPDAPTELGDLTLFFFSEFETADDAYYGDALLNLEAGVLSTVDLAGERADRKWIQPTLYEEHWGGAAGPAEIDPDVQVPITVAGLSTWPVSTHAMATLQPDQAPLEPSAPEHDRTYPNDTTCWSEETCTRLDTDNVVKKANILYDITYETEKDYRRLTLSDGRQAMVARTWNDSVALGDEGVNSIDQNYATEVFIESPTDSGQTQRMMAIWTSTTLPASNPSDELVRGTISVGIDGLFRRHDEFHAEQAGN
ncbi:MAG: hypothetical protein KDA24_20625 [Deltaproteobacteria bacterium]|nr:hypothetical protein [Deltaproteobacteria bacterium]